MPDEDAESPPGAGGCPGEAPLSTPRRCLAVSLLVWLVQRTAGPVPGARLPPLLDGVLDRPPLPRAAAEGEVNARQASVLHLQAAAGASVHDGAVLGGCGVRGGETDRQGGRQQWRDRDRTRERRTTETETEKDGHQRQRDRDGRTEREAERRRKIQRMKETERGEGDR